MNKLNKIGMLLAVVVSTTAGAQTTGTIDNWKNGTGELVWKNGTNEHCWRNANWTPATAAPGCDGAIVPAVETVPARVPVQLPAVQPATPQIAPPVQENLAPLVTKFTYHTDAFFDFDKTVLKPEGKAQLDLLIQQVSSINMEVIIATGHTDSVGSDVYNMRLSMRRAEAVKAYLVSHGMPGQRVYAQGKGEREPLVSNANAAGRAANRRVEIELVGTRSQ